MALNRSIEAATDNLARTINLDSFTITAVMTVISKRMPYFVNRMYYLCNNV